MFNGTQRRPRVNQEKARPALQRSARIFRFPIVRRIAERLSADCEHRWIFLAPGYQLCAKCGQVRKKP